MRKQHTAAFKAKIVLETLRETKTLTQVSFAANERVAAENQIHPTLLSKWRTEALGAFPDLFERGAKNTERSDAQEQRIEQLYQEVRRLTLQVNWLKKNLVSNLTRSERLALVERDADSVLSLVTQSDLRGLSRSSLCSEPRPTGEREVSVKRRLDELYTEHPSLGSRKVEILIENEGIVIGRHTIRRYRHEMGLETLYPKPNLSKAAQGQDHRVFPYLLRGLSIERPNQVWGVDITYVRLTAGWMYLVAFAALLRIA